MGSVVEKRIVHIEIASNMYLISIEQLDDEDAIHTIKRRIANQNSYLIVGKEKALLFDLALDVEGLYEYAKNLAKKDVMTVLSHGHFDHIFGLHFLKEVWMHKADEFLLKNGMPKFGGLPVVPCPILHFLNDKDEIELGERCVKVLYVPGHSPGSIVLLDKKTHILLSGDTVSRRVLMGASGKFDKDRFCESLEKLQQEEIDVIYSAHDEFPITQKHIDVMLGVLQGKFPVLQGKFYLSGIGFIPSYKYKKMEYIIFDEGESNEY